jgi:hypothetical protein
LAATNEVTAPAPTRAVTNGPSASLGSRRLDARLAKGGGH